PEVEENPEMWVQDEDVLDTWFSSSLWPFSSLGWPKKSDDLAKFYPNATLITGYDILFFWVARMILMGEYTMNDVPFHETFLHGLIYGKSYWREKEGHIQYVDLKEKREFDQGASLPKDVHSKWEKMSKSKGNVIDPIEIINQYGADAMRFALCSSATNARQIDLDSRRFEEYRNFVNKIWNGSRFVFMHLEDLNPSELEKGLDNTLLQLEDHWIFSLLNRTIKEVDAALSLYAFDQVVTLIYEFFWNAFCAYYLEMAKPILFGKQGSASLRINKQKILTIILSNSIRLMHPIAPFITEELFQHLNGHFPGVKAQNQDPYTKELMIALSAPACIVAPFPEVIDESAINPAIEEKFSFINKIVYAIRNVRAEMQLPPKMATDLFIIPTENNEELEILKANENILSSLIPLKKISIGSAKLLPEFHSSAIVNSIKLLIPLPREMQEKEKKRLEKEADKLNAKITQIEQKLANKNFALNAPKELVENTRKELESCNFKRVEIQKKLNTRL
ncbi:MAG: class I tRNA ligase family protein, partial [Simkaniaceae bacterium]|nr:class I tRNA ligase family protein [Simkaniaceae bacterium]